MKRTLLSFLMFLCLGMLSCYPIPSFEGLKCEEDEECYNLSCKNGYCGGILPEGYCKTSDTRSCYTGPANTQKNPPCQAGVQICINNVWETTCKGEQLPSIESCNGKDDDCDGQIDNGFDVGTTCQIQVGQCTSQGKKVCNSDGTGEQCDAPAITPTTETCNAKDDDCNGQTDEDYPEKGKPCQVEGQQGDCKQSAYSCQNGKLLCPPPTQPEICDGKDNDCDGHIDNGFDVGTSCTAGKGECQATGQMICNEAQTSTRCDAKPGTPANETCNGKDDDCDGQIDNARGTGVTCTYNALHCSTKGIVACQTNGQPPVCIPLPNTPDGCTGQQKGTDDNCNGQVDEDCSCTNGDTQPCYPGNKGCSVVNGTLSCKGQCQTGTQTCTNNKWTTCTNATKAISPICNLLDNDCDGEIDEPGNCLAKSYGKECKTDNDCGPGWYCENHTATLPNHKHCYSPCGHNIIQTKADISRCPKVPGSKIECLPLPHRGQKGVSDGRCTFVCNSGAPCPCSTNTNKCARTIYCHSGWCHEPETP